MSQVRVSGWFTIALVGLVLGCEGPEPPSRDPPPPRPRAAASSTQTSPGSPQGSGPPVADIAPPMASATAGEGGGLAGVWEGRYDAKKGSVTLPPKVKDKGFASDDGSVAVGPGSVELAVLANGDVRGKLRGALGAGAVRGKVDGAMIRSMVEADDPLSAHAMSGTLICDHKGDTLVCTLRVAGPDATMIRESAVELRRKK